MSDNYIFLKKNLNGSIVLSYEGIIENDKGPHFGYISEKVFYDYSKRNAIKKFKEEYGLKYRKINLLEI